MHPIRKTKKEPLAPSLRDCQAGAYHVGANWLASWLNPVQELYLIMNDAAALKKEWGLEKYNRTVVEYGLTFCKAASAWITVRNCSTEESIEQAFVDVVQGTIPPSETIVMDVVKAVAHRKQ